MHETQAKILELAKRENIAQKTLRELGKSIGVGEKPAVVQHHLEQLEQKGFLRVNRKARTTELLFDQQDQRLVRIPVLGAANCGEALMYPDEFAESYLTISKLVLSKMKGAKAALRAIGDSMNLAKVATPSGELAGIDEGDYVLIDPKPVSASDVYGKYVLSTIDGMANIKKIVKQDHGIALISESTKKYPPIYIDESEQGYFVSGTVVGVVK